MLKQCQDSYSTQFTQFPAMLAFHEENRKASLWERTEVHGLHVAALDKASPLYGDLSSFDPTVSQDAIADTAENLGLAIEVGFPNSAGSSWLKCSTPAWPCTRTAPCC